MRKVAFTIVLLSMSTLLESCGETRRMGFVQDQAFLNVASNPLAFEGKRVTVKGWVSLRDEDKNLWATWEDHEEWDTSKCISLMHYDVLQGREKQLDHQYVEVTGVLHRDASESGAIIRLAACRSVGIEIADAKSIKLISNARQQ
jgi:hypothetical protein